MSGRRDAAKKPRNMLRGVLLLCRGRAAGFAEFGNDAQDVLASLAPMIAFPLVGSLLMLGRAMVRDALTDFLATLCAVLAPPVLSHILAVRWGRADLWPRFAAAFNWCQWVLPLIGSILLLIGTGLLQAGVPAPPLLLVGLLVIAAYALWLHWFLARHGLELGRGRAALLVILVNLGTLVLIGGPQLLQRLAAGS